MEYLVFGVAIFAGVSAFTGFIVYIKKGNYRPTESSTEAYRIIKEYRALCKSNMLLADKMEAREALQKRMDSYLNQVQVKATQKTNGNIIKIADFH